jgi:hypothetical protein
LKRSDSRGLSNGRKREVEEEGKAYNVTGLVVDLKVNLGRRVAGLDIRELRHEVPDVLWDREAVWVGSFMRAGTARCGKIKSAKRSTDAGE